MSTLLFRVGWNCMALYSLFWLPNFACRLHRYDLKAYARLVAALLGDAENGENVNFVECITSWERIVTIRLRTASNTWVRNTVLLMLILLTMFVLAVGSLSSERLDLSR